MGLGGALGSGKKMSGASKRLDDWGTGPVSPDSKRPARVSPKP